jgi:hypothetical protein
MQYVSDRGDRGLFKILKFDHALFHKNFYFLFRL